MKSSAMSPGYPMAFKRNSLARQKAQDEERQRSVHERSYPRVSRSNLPIYGCANGVQTIVRGTVPAELFGRHGYGTIMGRLALWSFIARAIAPLALSLIAALGLAYDPSVPLLAAMALAALATYLVAIRRVPRGRTLDPRP